MSRIDELLQQKAAIDMELAQLKAEAEQQVYLANQQLQAVQAALGVEMKPAEKRHYNDGTVKNIKAVREDIDETDAGNGVRERDDNVSAASFLDELADLRARGAAKRARRA